MKNQILWFVLLVVFTCLMSSTCVKKADRENAIIIENKKNSSVYVYFSVLYPDTTLNSISLSILKHNAKYEILPNDSSYVGTYSILNPLNWKNIVPSDTILIFVLDKYSVDNEPWDYFKDGNRYLKRYKLSYNDIMDRKRKIIIE